MMKLILIQHFLIIQNYLNIDLNQWNLFLKHKCYEYNIHKMEF